MVKCYSFKNIFLQGEAGARGRQEEEKRVPTLPSPLCMLNKKQNI